MGKEHTYQLNLSWTGNTGQGTLDYRSYERSHIFTAAGKSELQGSAEPLYKGDASKWNPEELLLASLSGCHMLWYLHLCSVHKIIVTDYQDKPTALVEMEPTGDGRVIEVTLYPKILITAADKIEEALHLHEEAEKRCLIAKAVNFPVKHAPIVNQR